MNLSSRWMGLSLSNPVVASSSPLTRDVDSIRRLEDAGVGAVVMNSLYEDDVRADMAEQEHFSGMGEGLSAESGTYFPERAPVMTDLELYADAIRRIKERVAIPVVASVSCSRAESWREYARVVAEAGADAVEINNYSVPTDIHEPGQRREDEFLAVVSDVIDAVETPVSVKIHPYFTNLAHMVGQLDALGVANVTLFNRFYQPTIDVSDLSVGSRLSLRMPRDSSLEAMWIGILHGKVRLDMAASGGIASPEDALGVLMAGASVTMTCSALLKNGAEHVTTLVKGIESWCAANGYESVDTLRGILSQRRCGTPESFLRAQYVRAGRVGSERPVAHR